MKIFPFYAQQKYYLDHQSAFDLKDELDNVVKEPGNLTKVEGLVNRLILCIKEDQKSRRKDESWDELIKDAESMLEAYKRG